MNLKDTYERIAVDWHEDHQDDDWWVSGLEKFISLLPAGADVLDAGCAGGVKSKALAARGVHVIGIDFASNFIEIARKNVPEVEFRVLDIRDVSSMKENFDGIFLQAVLLHFPKKEVPSLLRGLLGRLKSGGVIHISVKESRLGQAEEEVVKEDDYGYAYERFFSFFSQQELKDILEGLGLFIVSFDVPENNSTRWLQVIARKN